MVGDLATLEDLVHFGKVVFFYELTSTNDKLEDFEKIGDILERKHSETGLYSRLIVAGAIGHDKINGIENRLSTFSVSNIDY